jgi:type II secretory pathway component PulM
VDLTQLAVPYPVLLAQYQERISALTNENVMLRATVTYLQESAPQAAPQPAQAAPQPGPQGLQTAIAPE